MGVSVGKGVDVASMVGGTTTVAVSVASDSKPAPPANAVLSAQADKAYSTNNAVITIKGWKTLLIIFT
jgi:hypothetical protein